MGRPPKRPARPLSPAERARFHRLLPSNAPPETREALDTWLNKQSEKGGVNFEAVWQAAYQAQVSRDFYNRDRRTATERRERHDEAVAAVDQLSEAGKKLRTVLRELARRGSDDPRDWRDPKDWPLFRLVVEYLCDSLDRIKAASRVTVIDDPKTAKRLAEGLKLDPYLVMLLSPETVPPAASVGRPRQWWLEEARRELRDAGVTAKEDREELLEIFGLSEDRPVFVIDPSELRRAVAPRRRRRRSE